MNKIFLLLTTTFILSTNCCLSQNAGGNKINSTKKTMESPWEKVSEYKGKRYEYKDIISEISGMPVNSLNDKIIFLTFWFAECSPCIAEFKPLNELYKKFKDCKSFELISITFENEKKISEFRKKYGIEYKIIHASEAECKKLNLFSGYPINILLDKGGLIDSIYLGGKESEEKLNSFFKDTIEVEIAKLLSRK